MFCDLPLLSDEGSHCCNNVSYLLFHSCKTGLYFLMMFWVGLGNVIVIMITMLSNCAISTDELFTCLTIYFERVMMNFSLYVNFT